MITISCKACQNKYMQRIIKLCQIKTPKSLMYQKSEKTAFKGYVENKIKTTHKNKHEICALFSQLLCFLIAPSISCQVLKYFASGGTKLHFDVTSDC